MSDNEYKFDDPPNTACITCKHITDGGSPILYVSHEADDGMWQFLCGEENHKDDDAAVVGLGEIAVIDPGMNGIADMPPGVSGERESTDGEWEFFRSAPGGGLHPEFPVVEGEYQITKEWRVSLPDRFNRRIEDGDLVIWRPGLTIFTAVWNNDHDESQQERLKQTVSSSTPDAYDEKTEEKDGVILYSYRLVEEDDDDRQPALYCFAIGRTGHVQMAIYFDDAKDIETAEAVWRSLAEGTDD